ncbi:uncharacterized protein LOC131430597 [Malaya genurostris]|uniref:uncharacterized protein LOC131430597 n=1 Tax=Malaya genurostris TaxID=325434 RepID=UPI0026F3B7E6|nr:uncharacterized protein LOC131430597 [Malaya genurostris]
MLPNFVNQWSMEIKNLTIQKYCEHYKPLMVEEIILVEHPTKLHYGKCSVIGYLVANRTSLESLMVPDLPEDLQLPDGMCQLDLSFDNYLGSVPRNCTVRLYGSLKMKGPTGTTMNCSKDLIASLQELRASLEQDAVGSKFVERRLQKEFDVMSYNYHPILDVEGCEVLPQARDILSCDLRLRRINKRLEPTLQELQNNLG